MSGVQNLATRGLGDGGTLVTEGYGDTPPPPPPQTGTISISSAGDNGAALHGIVSVDGTPLGNAPQTGTFSVGAHLATFGGVSGYSPPGAIVASVLLGIDTPVVGIYIGIGTLAPGIVACPKCGSALEIRRMGRLGIPDSALGKQRKTSDSSRFKCGVCGETFRSKGLTLSEAMGTRVE